MKKIIVPIALLAVVAIVAMPYFTGTVAESATRDMVAQLNAQSLEYGETEITDYQRGYRSSETTFEWKPPAELQALFVDSPDEGVRYRCAGEHGLISYDYQCKLLDVPAYRELIEQELGGQDPLTLSGSINVFGEATQRIGLNAFEVEGNDGETLTVQSGYLDFALDQSLKNISVAGEFGGMSMQGSDEDGSVSLGQASVDGNFTINQHKMAIGDLTMTLADMQATDDEDGTFVLGDMSLTTYAREQEENLAAGYRVGVKSIALESPDEAGVIEPLDMSNLVAEFGASGVNMAQLAVVTENMQRIGREISAQTDLDDPDVMSNSNALMLSMLPELESLLIAGLGLNGQFSADYAGKPMTATLDFELLRNLSLGDFVLLSVQPKALFAKLKAGLDVVIPQTLIERDADAAEAIVKSPWYRKTTDGYNANLLLDGESVVLNGREMEIEEFLGFVMQAMVPADAAQL